MALTAKSQEMVNRFQNSIHVNNLNYHNKLNYYLKKKNIVVQYTSGEHQIFWLGPSIFISSKKDVL